MKINLYDKDYYLWLEETAQLLREGKLTELDVNNLIEEIEDMGRSEKKAVKSNLKILLCHLLKYKYQPEKRSRSWLSTIFEHRDRLDDDFADSPSLKRYFDEVFESCYQKARKQASIETGLPLEIFPINCPFTFEQVLNMDYLPE
ncbi:MAG: DUF29 domain-containing protein [Crocosphaera sp.]|nr:DUF29 domain-containing protein [Crocosphaera sp.]